MLSHPKAKKVLLQGSPWTPYADLLQLLLWPSEKEEIWCLEKKNLKGYWSLLPKVFWVGQGEKVKKKRKEEKDEVVDQEIRKEICQCRIFPPGLLTRDTARAVAGSDHPVRSMGWKRHRELTRIYEDPYKMPSTACIWILVCRQVMFLFPTQAP